MERSGESARSQQITRALARILTEGRVAALATVVLPSANNSPVGSKLLVENDGLLAGTSGEPEFDAAVARYASSFIASRVETRTARGEDVAPELSQWAGARIMFERIEPEPHVVVCGAGHVGAHLARITNLIGYRVTLIDDRPEFVARQRFPEEGIQLVAASTWSAAVSEVVGTGHGVSVAVVTRGHSEDEECLRAVLQSRPDYVGMIGSKRRTNIVLARLRASGVQEELLQQVHAPIGLDIHAVTPEEVALAILAEIIAHRRGGEGGSLSAWRREAS